ncbi:MULTISPECIES: FAD-binding oxidoreductase [unclassified Pantoea]|uniref:NAD(P)/FAD-dependent oxidoreductase n=1 Tax=unclassified Pantoea TaxID=2630326 RepID=UPI0024779EF1|nr:MULTISPECIES: FAD-binding oxidoreductase [unclassified Pantoea]GME41396.1 FAD-binding oxidoreductase [Pantoea sp. QMID1]GME42796.1 FAD-binding oxidoreductase [Pantoea sp. QMID3]GME56799.1 FAD-binding oxidoreductase [Pantoea sp. QMID4]GME59042.1 FAD-binding oxidoreductase [Pantoea sp. QMID2]
MAPVITPVTTSDIMPAATTVVIIGGGIVGLTAALTLAERNIPVVVLEKGRIAGEQSSRNLGWVRKTSRALEDIPLAQAADRLWAAMAARVGSDVGYRRAGIMFVARDEKQMAIHEKWLNGVDAAGLDTRLLSNSDIAAHVPGGAGKWAGGIFTASDGRAEPTLAASAIAKAALANGAVIIEQCAVRALATQNGRVSGVVTEKGEICCDQVLLAAGAWSRRFLGNHGINLPTLPLICSVMRTKPLQGPTNIAVGAPDFSFRQHQDGGFIITQRGALDAPLTLDHLLIGARYVTQLRHARDNLRISLGKFFVKDLAMARRWRHDRCTPFEHVRTLDPQANPALNNEAMRNLRAAWPAFKQAEIAASWAGVIDVTPDSNPVIGPVPSMPGLTLATGFSGHGFGTSPAAGQLAADLVTGQAPVVDPLPYCYERLM